MMTNEKNPETVGEETYTAPLLTKHDALRGLTGFSTVGKTRNEV